MSEVRFFRECETCKGSGSQAEYHGQGLTEYLSCQDCRGTGAGAEVRLVREWWCYHGWAEDRCQAPVDIETTKWWLGKGWTTENPHAACHEVWREVPDE